MSRCRIRVEELRDQPGYYEVRRTEQGDCYGYPIRRIEPIICHDSELDDLVRQLKTEPSKGIARYTDINVIATPELEWRLTHERDS